MNEDILNQLRTGVTTSSPEETRALAKALAEVLPEEAVLGLYGDLGVGKSVFVSGLAQGWGITQPTVSPTFNLYHLYEGVRRLIHLDAYRLENASQMDTLMLEDFMLPPFCLVVEWASRIESWLPEDALRIELSIVEAGVHRLQIV